MQFLKSKLSRCLLNTEKLQLHFVTSNFFNKNFFYGVLLYDSITLARWKVQAVLNWILAQYSYIHSLTAALNTKMASRFILMSSILMCWTDLGKLSWCYSFTISLHWQAWKRNINNEIHSEWRLVCFFFSLSSQYWICITSILQLCQLLQGGSVLQSVMY